MTDNNDNGDKPVGFVQIDPIEAKRAYYRTYMREKRKRDKAKQDLEAVPLRDKVNAMVADELGLKPLPKPQPEPPNQITVVPVSDKSSEPSQPIESALDLLDLSQKFTEKQIEFLEFFSECGVIAQAARKSNYSKHHHHELSLLLREPRTLAFLRLLREKAIQEAVLTSTEVIAKARKVYERALDAGDFKAAMDATKSLGNFMGMNVERSENVTKNITFNSGDAPKDVVKDLEYFKDILAKTLGGPGADAKKIN